MNGNPLSPTPPPDGPVRPSVPIVRCGPGSQYRVRALVLSEEVHGFNTHYSGRTVPCLDSTGECELCEQRRAIRWLGYVHATDPIHRVKRFLLEFTPGVMPDIQRYVDQYRTLRGAWVELTRAKAHPTSRLVVNLVPFRECPPGELPVAGDVRQDLWRIWSGSFSERKDGDGDRPDLSVVA